MISGIVILTLAIIFVAAGLFVIALLILWPFLKDDEPDLDPIERFENEAKSRWLHGRG